MTERITEDSIESSTGGLTRRRLLQAAGACAAALPMSSALSFASPPSAQYSGPTDVPLKDHAAKKGLLRTRRSMPW